MTALFALMLAFLKEAFTENVGLKLLSLSFAVGLFAFVYGQQDEQLRTVPVAVVLRPPAEGADRELMTQIPADIHITLRGPARAIDRLIQEGMPPIELDLRQGNKEQITFEAGMFQLPPTPRSRSSTLPVSIWIGKTSYRASCRSRPPFPVSLPAATS